MSVWEEAFKASEPTSGSWSSCWRIRWLHDGLFLMCSWWWVVVFFVFFTFYCGEITNIQKLQKKLSCYRILNILNLFWNSVVTVTAWLSKVENAEKLFIFILLENFSLSGCCFQMFMNIVIMSSEKKQNQNSQLHPVRREWVAVMFYFEFFF